jgi:hypothetical protein
MVRLAPATVAAALLTVTALTARADEPPANEPPATSPPSPEPTPPRPDPPPAPAPEATTTAVEAPASAPIPVAGARTGLDEGGLFFGLGGGPIVGMTSNAEVGGMGVFELGGGVGARESPRSVLTEVGIGIPLLMLGRGDHKYIGSAFTLVGRFTWQRGPFEVGVRVAPGARFGSRSRAKDAESSTQLGLDASPEIFLRATRALWIGLGLDVLVSAPTFEGTRGLPAITGGPSLKILLLPFN